MIDILFLAWNRLRFTHFAISALLHNTNWKMVRSLWLYDDGSVDGTLPLLKSIKAPCETLLVETNLRSPVAIMNDFVVRSKTELFAKIDNDTVVPPLWLEECEALMHSNPKLDILGIEPMHQVKWGPVSRSCVITRWIGGIGLIHSRIFKTFPCPNGLFGFTGWQKAHPEIVKAWIKPALPVILLNRVPVEPWCRLSEDYKAKGWQRQWDYYTQADRALWGWWEGICL